MYIAIINEISLCIAFLYVSKKLNTANIYKDGPVPEVITHIRGIDQDHVQLSSLDLLTKSCVHDSIGVAAFMPFSVCRCSDWAAVPSCCLSKLALS